MHRRSQKNRGPLAGVVPPPDGWEKAHFDEVARFIANWCWAWDDCGLPACARSRRCRGPGVPCFERNAAMFYESLYDAPAGRRLFEIAVDAAENELFE